MKTGYIQFAPVLGELDATISGLDSFIDSCCSADILVLPELCNSGYNFQSEETARETAEKADDSVFLKYLISKCDQHQLHIVSGFNEIDGDKLYNSAVLTGPEGIIGKYRKLHLFMNEKKYFTPGDLGLPVFDIGICKIGLLVCFDWIFPEAWRVLALKGADLICHPSNLVLPGFAQKAVPVRALTNHFYVVTANRVGTEGELTFTGLSTIADPKGEVLLQGSQTNEETGIVDIDIELAGNKMITPLNDLLKDRRPEEYTSLTI